MTTCRRCGGLLDATRENPKTRRFGRKCPDCLRWHEAPIAAGHRRLRAGASVEDSAPR
jgi:hypothetical protein